MSLPNGASVLRSTGGARATLAKILAVARVTLETQLAYFSELILRSAFLVLVLYTFAQLWRATDQTQGVLASTGFSIPQMIWYLVFTEAIVMSAPGLADREVDREVRSGEIVYRLARPLAYPLHHLAAAFADRLLRFFVNLGVGCLIALAVVGPIELVPLRVASAIGAAFVAFVADWVWSFSISLLSFWVEDTYGLHLLYRRFLMILGGLLIPIDAYPEWLAAIARALPFQYLIYHPSRLFVAGAEGPGFVQVVAVLAAIAAVGAVFLAALYSRGLRRVSAQGG